MKGFFSGKGFKVLVTVVCIFLAVALVTAGNGYMNDFFASFVLTPLRQVASEGVEAAGDALTPPKSNEELQEEVSRLERENRDLSDRLVDYYDIKKQNEELRKFYDIKKENKDFSIVPSTVIGRDPNENFYGFTADKGSLDGVDINNPVMTEKGLVGWVSEVSPRSCRVTTVLSPDAQIGAVVKRTDDSGIISGSGGNVDEGKTEMLNLSEQNSAKKGDIVVTSGYGGIYPKNLKIGKIAKLTMDEYTGMPVAVIEPYEDIQNVSSVVLITDFDGKGEPETVQSSDKGS